MQAVAPALRLSHAVQTVMNGMWLEKAHHEGIYVLRVHARICSHGNPRQPFALHDCPSSMSDPSRFSLKYSKASQVHDGQVTVASPYCIDPESAQKLGINTDSANTDWP